MHPRPACKQPSMQLCCKSIHQVEVKMKCHEVACYSMTGQKPWEEAKTESSISWDTDSDEYLHYFRGQDHYPAQQGNLLPVSSSPDLLLLLPRSCPVLSSLERKKLAAELVVQRLADFPFWRSSPSLAVVEPHPSSEGVVFTCSHFPDFIPGDKKANGGSLDPPSLSPRYLFLPGGFCPPAFQAIL